MIDLEILELSSVHETEYLREYNHQSAYNKKRISIMRPKDKRRSLAGLILLRKKIAERYGLTDYEFTYNENGKPLLDFCYFSISHSGEYVACALGNTPVGVDTEVIRDIPFRNDYRLFTLEEVVYVNECEKEHNLRFFEIWTKKEAYIKAKGFKLIDGSGINVLNLPDAEFSTEIIGENMLTLCKIKQIYNEKTEEN